MKQVFLMICISLAVLAAGNSLSAQSAQDASDGNDEKLSLSVEVASGFVWRGISLNSTPVVQPAITFSPGNFSIGAWASTPFTPYEYQEFDIFAEYQISSSLSVGLVSYFDYSSSYFDFKKTRTGHAFDLMLMYGGSDNFPLRAMVSTIIAGADLNDKGKSNFSTYLELGYGNTTQKGMEWEVFTGFVPMKSGFYGLDGANVINLGFGVTKSFDITPTYSLPLSLRLSVNPAYESIFFVASIALF